MRCRWMDSLAGLRKGGGYGRTLTDEDGRSRRPRLVEKNSREKNFSRGVFRAWSPWLVCQRPGYVTNERLTVAMPEMGFVCSGWEEKQRVGVNSISILGSRLTTNERLKFEQSRE